MVIQQRDAWDAALQYCRILEENGLPACTVKLTATANLLVPVGYLHVSKKPVIPTQK